MVAIRIRPAIVLFGDSITQQGFGMDGKIGWASLMASDYSRRADVLNRGFSGYNTRFAIDLLPSIFSQQESNVACTNSILFATVWFGANDAALPGERQHVPLEEYGKNLETIVNTIRSNSGDVKPLPIILMTPPPFDAASWRKTRNLEVDGRANEVARSYGEQAKLVGQKLNCNVLDVWETLQGETSPEVYVKYLSDGLHLNEEGNRKVYQGLMALIQAQLPELAPMEECVPTGIPLEGKLWDELC